MDNKVNPKVKPEKKPPQGKEWYFDDVSGEWLLRDKSKHSEENPTENKDLFGDPENGKFLCYTRMSVSVTEELDKVAVYMPSPGKFKLVKDKVEGTGDTLAEAMKSFRAAFKAAN